MTEKKYWIGKVSSTDDFGGAIVDVFYDAKTIHGPWAIMNEVNWSIHGGTNGKLGCGFGQKYQFDKDSGRWMKVEG